MIVKERKGNVRQCQQANSTHLHKGNRYIAGGRSLFPRVCCVKIRFINPFLCLETGFQYRRWHHVTLSNWLIIDWDMELRYLHYFIVSKNVWYLLFRSPEQISWRKWSGKGGKPWNQPTINWTLDTKSLSLSKTLMFPRSWWLTCVLSDLLHLAGQTSCQAPLF